MHDSIRKQVEELGPWFHQIDLGDGVRTRSIAPAPGPQPENHPQQRWEKIMHELPPDLSGMRILDLGCSDGFFAIKMAERGADEIVAIDGAGKAIQRLAWAAPRLGLDAIQPLVADVYRLPEDLGRFDFVLMFALLYHVKEPLLCLEIVSQLSDTLYLETIAVDDDENSHLKLQLPREGVHAVPKWFPTTRCLKDMLNWVGYTEILEIADCADSRPIYRAHRGPATKKGAIPPSGQTGN